MRSTHRRHVATAIASLFATACITGMTACGKGEPAASSTPPVAGKLSVVAARTDTTRPASEAGLPSGYHAVFDDATSSASAVTYTQKDPGRWEVKTGPAHILYSPADTAKNRYSVSATFEQLQAPAHPEAFGVFVGGSGLGTPRMKYTYFLVRGDGMYMIKVRDGAATRTITDWTAQPSIPKQDAAGKGLYGIQIQVRDNAANVSVNGIPITTINGKAAPLNGITGVRINHNLDLIVTPVSVIR